MQHCRTDISVISAIVVAGVIVGGAIAFAQSGTASAGIAFPVQELGNCASKEACHDYCELGEHMDACIAFAKAHGLMNEEEAERSEKFSARMKEGKTPGNCTSPASCNAYCEDVTHLDECIRFAETEGFKGEEYERGKKIRSYLKGGGTMPGGCTSRASCEAYCGDFSRAEECFRFAEGAGINDEFDAGDDGRGPPEGITAAQVRILAELAQKGGTPGGCTNKDACMAYCANPDHMEECITFGEKVGFMKKEEVEHARAFMEYGGPGGCTSQEACHTFCNDPANHETCFRFAEEHGLIPEEEVTQMKEGWLRMRQGIESAPAEVGACLRSTMGENVVADIQSGKLLPGPEIGGEMRGCFEKFGADHRPQQIFFEAPPEVKACLNEKLGDTYAGITSGKVAPTPEMADTFRICFQQVEFERSNGWGVSGEAGRENDGGIAPNPAMMAQFLRSAPPEISACLKEKLGERFGAIERGEVVPGPELGETMRSCFESFRPMHGEMPTNVPLPPMQSDSGLLRGEIVPVTPPLGVPPVSPAPEMQMMNFMNQFPLGISGCLREKLGEEGFMKIAMEGRTPELELAIRTCAGAVVGGDPAVFTPPPAPAGGVYPTGVWTDTLPLPVQSCLREKFPDRYASLGFQAPTGEVEIALRACYAEVSGGTIQVVPPPPSEPPPPTQSRRTVEYFLGAVFAPFTALMNTLR